MIFKKSTNHNVKSAGTNDGAEVKLTEKLLTWADLIFVMEKKHRQLIKLKFQTFLDFDKLIVLDIPDEYEYMDEELILSLKTAVTPYLDNVI